MSATPPSPQDLRERARELCQGFTPPPRTELPRFDRCEAVHVLLNGDEVVDGFERGLAKGARIQGALDLAIAEGLEALTVSSQPVWLPGEAARAVRAGATLAPEGAVGRRTWEQFLAERVAPSPR